MTRPSLILHIGSQKTGSTAIQSALKISPESLEASGLRFVTSARKHISHNRLWAAIDAGRPRGSFINVRREIAAHPDHCNILSCEMFFREGVAPMFGRFLPVGQKKRTKVVVYLRRQDQFLEAMFKQHLKNGLFKGSVHTYLNVLRDRLSYSRALSEFNDVFGQENMTVIPYERHQFAQHNVVADFAEHANWQNLPQDALGLTRVNATLAWEYCAILGRLINVKPVERRAVISRLIGQEDCGTVAHGDCMTPENRSELLSSLAEDNETVRRRWRPDLEQLFTPSSHDDGVSAAQTAEEKRDRLEKAMVHVNEILATIRTENGGLK